MIQIREGVFETNSSSTHSICISKQKVNTFPSSVHFGLETYGWDFNCVTDTCSYLYSAIMEFQDTELKDIWLERIKTILAKHDIEATFETSDKNYWYGVDHVYELESFIDEITQDEDKLLRFLLNFASCVYTGNDNESKKEDMCNVAKGSIHFYEDGEWKTRPHPYYDPDHFEYEYKDN